MKVYLPDTPPSFCYSKAGSNAFEGATVEECLVVFRDGLESFSYERKKYQTLFNLLIWTMLLSGLLGSASGVLTFVKL